MIQKILLSIFLFGIFFFWEISTSLSEKGKKNKYDAHINSFNDFSVPIEKKSISYQLSNELSTFKNSGILDKNISEFLNVNDIKGASVAVASHGRLVYAKGFGYANIETNENVEPKHLFRLASVSKLITASGIMKLVEDGKLALDQTVFGPDGILNDSIYLNFRDKRIEQITIKNLLNHTSGWNDLYGDPMFIPFTISRISKLTLPLRTEDVIQFSLNIPLSSNPGTEYLYSNLGYVILGEVINKITGMTYEDYIVSNILNPIGIYDMRLGKSFYEQRARNEVKYYVSPLVSRNTYSINGTGEIVPEAYGGNDMEMLGAAGGWIASAPELMKFVLAMDGYPEVPDILKPETIELMVTPAINTYTLLGWRGTDTKGTWWRTGTLSGTSALIVRQNNDMVWIVLTNTTTPKLDKIHSEISRFMFSTVYSIKEWPETDLFDYGMTKPLSPIMLTSIENTNKNNTKIIARN